MKIDSYDKYINKMITQANFNYATTLEGTVDGGLDLTGLAGAKMLVEGVTGKNYITNEEYSDEQRGIRIAPLGAGSLLGKVLSKATVGTVADEEAASVSKTGGIVLSMNGTGELDNLFNKITKNINEGKDSKEEIYDFTLMLLYRECCVNVSVPYRIIRVMMSVEEDLDKIFLDITEKTNENNISSVIITLNILYSPIGNFNKFNDKLVVKLLEKVKNAITNNNDELLKITIKQQLCEKINNDKYKEYLEEFNRLMY